MDNQREKTMGSVYVSWEGRCQDRRTQEELVGFLRELARHSAVRLQGSAPARPAFLEFMTAQRREGAARVEPIRTFDQELTGQIVLDPCLAPDGQQLAEEVQKTGTELVAVEAGAKDKVEPFCLSLGSRGAPWCLRLGRLRLFGIDFRLFDPRDLYPQADRMSFVFLDSPELPALRGCLAQVETREQCQAYPGEVIRSADWYVSPPNIHLRYYYEEWSDLLLGWVKYFFIPDLRYQRYEELPQYEAIRGVLEEQCRQHDSATTKRLVFDYLVDRFASEADEWTQRIGGMA
jgi:hypothetical protein